MIEPVEVEYPASAVSTDSIVRAMAGGSQLCLRFSDEVSGPLRSEIIEAVSSGLGGVADEYDPENPGTDAPEVWCSLHAQVSVNPLMGPHLAVAPVSTGAEGLSYEAFDRGSVLLWPDAFTLLVTPVADLYAGSLNVSYGSSMAFVSGFSHSFLTLPGCGLVVSGARDDEWELKEGSLHFSPYSDDINAHVLAFGRGGNLNEVHLRRLLSAAAQSAQCSAEIMGWMLFAGTEPPYTPAEEYSLNVASALLESLRSDILLSEEEWAEWSDAVLNLYGSEDFDFSPGPGFEYLPRLAGDSATGSAPA